VIGAEGLGKRFGERTALRDVTFAVHPGERVAVIGPNGAGKTTLLSLLGGVLPPSDGRVQAPAALGWVPQQPAVYRKLSVRENLELFARLEGVGEPDAAVERMLDQTGLRDRAGDELGRLSGGNQQRVNIAVGLLSDPEVLLLDEPSSSLDPLQRARLWEFLDAMRTTILFTTHEVSEAERHADRVLVLADGDLVFTGSPGELHRAVGDESEGFEAAFVRFLRERGH